MVQSYEHCPQTYEHAPKVMAHGWLGWLPRHAVDELGQRAGEGVNFAIAEVGGGA
jgi:hypothetical protein